MQGLQFAEIILHGIEGSLLLLSMPTSLLPLIHAVFQAIMRFSKCS